MEADVERIQKALDTLGEYYDTCHIFLMRHDGGPDAKTFEWQKGIGNFNARYGQIKLWTQYVERQDAEPSNPADE